MLRYPNIVSLYLVVPINLVYFEIFGYDRRRCAYLFGDFDSESHFKLKLPSRVQVTTLPWFYGFTLVNIFNSELEETDSPFGS